MAKQHSYQWASEEQMEDTEYAEGCLHPLSSSDALLNAPNPSPPPSHPYLEPWTGREPAGNREIAAVSANAPGPLIAGEGPLLASEVYSSTAPVRTSPNECSLCHKMFGTTNALNKHLLTHQQGRPHVCPICQRAFKRHDHLNGHMLTHQKRKQFRCAEPGCRKSYYDSHSLRRHYISQHGVSLIQPTSQSVPHPSRSTMAQWKPVDSATYLGGSVAHTNSHSTFLSPPKLVLEQKGSDCSGFGSYNSYKGFDPQSGVQVNNYSVQNLFQAKPVSVLDPWRQGSDKGPCNDCTGELHPTQWAPGPQVSNTATAASLPPEVEGPGLQSWESGFDFPVSDLQALEEMLSYPCNEAGNSGEDCSVKPSPAAERSTQSKQHQSNVIKQTHGQTKTEGKAQVKPQFHYFQSVNPTACSDSNVASKSVPNAAVSRSSSALPNNPVPPPPPPPPPAIVPPVLYSVVKSNTCPSRVENKRKRERRKVVRAVDLPAPPLPSPCPTSLLAPRRPRPRPLYLVSPSQVAMASFSTDITCQPFKGGNASLLGDGQEVSDRMPPSSHPPTNHDSKARLSDGPSFKMEPHSPELEERRPKVQMSPSRSDHVPLSPLVIPVSVPVSAKTDSDMAHSDRGRLSNTKTLHTEEPQGSAGRPKKNRRLDFMKSLIIPPPMLPPPSPRRHLAEEGGVGLWCRAAGGYPSQLRSPLYLADHLLNTSFQPPPYTPPPMLSPLRPGTGLYFNTLPPLHPCPPPPSTYTATLDGTDGISMVMDDTVVSIQPRINVGQRFQAEIPPTRNMLLMLYDDHPAQLVWAPWGDISSNLETQRKVTELMALSCSSVLPGGGTNTELALHCLHEVQGDILAALDLLLIRGDFRSSTHPLSNYHYPGSDHWSPHEKRLIRKALLTHEKDFQLIHSELQTKSVSQCVEYYYAMKKLKHFKQHNRGSDKKEGGSAESQTDSPGYVEDNQIGRRGPRRSLTKQDKTRGAEEEQPTTGGALEYTCQVCGRIFDRVKSRSAHMKTHRQQEREWLTRYGWSRGCPAE